MCSKCSWLIAVVAALAMGATTAHADNQLRNWEFDEPIAAENWWLWETADFERVEPVPDETMSGDMSLRIVIPDGAAGSLQLIQSYLELVQGETYYISFMARADEPRVISSMLLGRTTHNWAQFWFMGNIELTTEVQTFTYEYTHTGPTVGGTGNFNDDIDIYFNLGDSDVDLNIDRVWIDTEPAPEIVVPVAARKPDPAHMTTDVPIDVILAWTAGEYAATHDVYLGTVFDDVNAASRANPMDVLVSQGQAAATFEPPTPLEFAQTYYWRIDEVNAAPDNTIFKGDVWSFTVEPYVYPIGNIVATASGAGAGAGPENTINGSGLDSADQHSIRATDMWLTTGGAGATWIQYEFDDLYKLYEMWVWNYNVQFEPVLGFGLKDVTVDYSTDGIDWITLGDVEIAQATARADYTANTMVDLSGVAARFVRLTVNGGWGPMGQFGLSEVRFFHLPAKPRDPAPAFGQADVDLDVTLDWRGGREAVSHTVYFSSDRQAVETGAALVDSVSQSRYAVDGLDLGTTYYWKVDEVNEAASPGTWEGDIWSFSTRESFILEDFESYDDEENRIFDTWIDGFFNDTGSTVGYFDAPFAEQSIVNSGGQSMPLEYNNTAAPFYSEAERDLGFADWTTGGADTLVVHFRGNPAATPDQAGNDPDTLYVAVEDTAGRVAVVTHPDSDATVTTQWQPWQIPFSEFAGVDMSSVAIFYIGLGDRDNPAAGGTGLLYIDDIQVGHPVAAPTP
jgi:F5/8 type C domain-containing protein/carbohydrate binding protein with CBM4/9 domain